MGRISNRMTAVAMMAACHQIMQNGMALHIQQQQIAEIAGQYSSRGKGGKRVPRTFSGVARARREAKKARNRASH